MDMPSNNSQYRQRGVKNEALSNLNQAIPIGSTSQVLETFKENDENAWGRFITFIKKKSPSLDDKQDSSNTQNNTKSTSQFGQYSKKVYNTVKEYGKFIGPGFMISVAYMDPGNYSTDVSAGANFRFDLLFVVFLSNCIAVYLQSLAIKLGTVTGRDLAQVSRDELPRWVNLVLYALAEIAIIATDIAEVIGTAVALNILLKIPLIAGVLITIIDVLIVLMAYRPGNSMHLVHIFEYGVALLVFAVVICFAIQLSRIPSVPVGEVFRGYIPSSGLI